MPIPSTVLAAAVIDGKLYAVGGLNFDMGGAISNLQVYDPATDVWTAAAPMGTARHSLAAAAINRKLYAIGGANPGTPSSIVELYDPASGTWTTKPSMPTPRSLLGAAAIDGKLYAVGGRSGPLSTLEVYDPVTEAWTTKPAMPTARESLATVSTGGRLYAIGGSNGGPLSTLEVYEILPAPPPSPTHFSVSTSPITTAGNNLSVVVTALDDANNKVIDYGGTVHFTSSDGAAVLRALRFGPLQIEFISGSTAVSEGNPALSFAWKFMFPAPLNFTS